MGLQEFVTLLEAFLTNDLEGTGFDPGAHVMLGLMGIGAVIAFLGLLLYILLVVAAVFLGPSLQGKAMVPWHEEVAAEGAASESDGEHHTPGTLVLAIVFLLTFAVYYFANWKWLSDVWEVR